MTEPYEYRTNFKNKPDSQGTLFQVNDKSLLNPAQRWPRGYTPARQNEVRDALKDTPIAQISQKTDGDREGRARIVDTVARSTMPASHLEGLSDISYKHVLKGTAGTYYPGPRKLGIDMFAPPDRGGDREKTLMHELGHHADSMKMDEDTRKTVTKVAADHVDWPHDTEPNTTAKLLAERKVYSGVREATADNYATEHFRTRGRNPQATTEGRYEENWTHEERESRYPGYNDVRPSKNLGPQFEQKGLF